VRLRGGRSFASGGQRLQHESPCAWDESRRPLLNAKFSSRSHDAVIRVYDEAGNVIETHEHAGDFKETLDYPFTSIRV
jgi:hypothetical protein